MSYNSLEQLKSKASLPDHVVKQFNRKSCDEVYTSFEQLLKSACAPGQIPETQFQLFWRCCELADIIRKKNGFSMFKNKEAFYKRYTICVDKMEELTSLLKIRLNGAVSEPKSVNSSTISADSASIKEKSITESKPATPDVIPEPTISPKFLIRAAQNEKKSAIILDYRADQSTQTFAYPKDSLIRVVSIPRDVLHNGLIFSNLKQNIPVGQRAVLGSLSEYDTVVLMEDQTPEMKNGEPVKGTAAHLLLNAVYEYNQECKPKAKPLIMDGGFEMLRAQYPTYIKGDQSLKRAGRDRLDDMIHNYKKTIHKLPSYPTIFSPPKPKPERVSPTPPARPPALPHRQPPRPPVQLPSKGEVNGVEPSSGAVAAAKISEVKISPAPPTELPRNVTPTVPDKPPTSSSSGVSITEENGVPGAKVSMDTVSPLPKPSVASNGFATVTPTPPTVPPTPSVDRTSKPAAVSSHTNITVPQPPPSSKPALTPRHPSPDRSTKPKSVRLSPENERVLLGIYHEMAENILHNSTRRSSSRPGYTGLYNMGNTCFMSASLQALFHTPQLLNVFTKENFMSKVNPSNSFGTKGIISAVFSALLDHVWSGEYSAIKPQRFLQLFAGEVNSSLADGQQHDASEFQLFLLDALHEDTNQVHKRISFSQDYKGGVNIAREAKDFAEKSLKFSHSPVNQIFNFQSVSELHCLKCGERSATFEESSLISVELPHSSVRRTNLKQCLNSHFAETRLEGDSRWHCPRCKCAQPTNRSTNLWKLPPILVVHLKRFSIVHGEYEKNNMEVEFDPSHLDMSPYMHRSAKSTRGDMYRLYAVTNHRGRLNSGHYTAVVSHARTGEWLRMDDESVTATTAASIDMSDAYILYYKKVNL